MNLSDATAVYAGTTEATALYYGPQLLWNVPGWEPPAPDPFFENVSLLLKMDGVDGGSVFIDSSNNGLIVTATGATTSTLQSKFGPTSMLCGSTRRLDISGTSQFYFPDDFTIEFWVWKDSTQLAEYPRLFELATYLDGLLIGLDGIFANGTLRIGVIPFQNNNWSHYALTKSNNTLRSFVNGVQHGADALISNSVPQTITSPPLRIGQSSHVSGQYLVGYIDELRITKGVARYTENFTPPSEPFPTA
jgi:hypothetical protein